MGCEALAHTLPMHFFPFFAHIITRSFALSISRPLVRSLRRLEKVRKETSATQDRDACVQTPSRFFVTSIWRSKRTPSRILCTEIFQYRRSILSVKHSYYHEGGDGASLIPVMVACATTGNWRDSVRD